MSIDRLIYSCIQEGSSFSEKSKTASIAKKSDELLLVFHTDNNVARQILGITRSCDAAFFFMRYRSRPVLIFCELKGKDVASAAEQIKSTLLAVRNLVRSTIRSDFPQNFDIKAVVVRSGSAPHNQGKLQEKFIKETGVKLQFARERVDLRSLLTER